MRQGLGASMQQRKLGLIILAAVAALIFSPPRSAAKSGAATSSEDFFIISSVDRARQQLLLKFPTEVTEVMRVEGSTRYFDESGKPIKLADLRAGDTVYVKSVRGPGGLTAVRIRKGPMTLEELRRRYLQGQK